MDKGRTIKKVLTIAGSDTSGGAGVQADIKTMTMHGVYAMSAITALTAQNTLGVRATLETTPAFLKEQLDAVFEDIFPDSIKIGMAVSESLINTIAERLRFYNARNIVVDPVMLASSGARLMHADAVSALTERLFPIATLITPNIPEAETLSGSKVNRENDMITVAKHIAEKYSCAVLLKGGHSIHDANDLLYDGEEFYWFYQRRIDNPNTHGTGCTLSSAIAANLAKGFSVYEAVKRAKAYISDVLSACLDIGKGTGPLLHNFGLHTKYTEGKDA